MRFKKIKIINLILSIIKHSTKWIVNPNYRRLHLLIDFKCIKFFQLGSLRIANLAFSGRADNVTTDQLNFTKSSGIFGGIGVLDIHKIYQEWNYAGYLWNAGYYKKFCEVSKNCLEKIYHSQKIDDSEQVPPMLSYGWGHSIGHMGSLGAFLNAQNIGIIPSLKRILPVYSIEQSNQIQIYFQHKITQFKYTHSYSLLDHPTQWHLSERLMMIKTCDDFISLYDLHERTYSALIEQKKESHIHLDPEYEIHAQVRLTEIGLPKDSWFVGFHLRENQDPLDSRCASLKSFIPSLKKINECGGWVVRFGTGTMEPINDVKNIIDLNLDIEEYRYLHPYILANSKFILITNSGPAAMAWALGTPVLQTNTTSIARNILSASKGTLWLPKIWVKDGEMCSYEKVISSLEGYSETNLREKEKAGYRVLENSEDEILEATKDMLGLSKPLFHGTKYKKQINDIRQHYKVVGYGEIAPSYLDKHSDWFLK